MGGTAAKLEAVLAGSQVPHDVKEYPHVGRSFMNDHAVPAPIRLVAGKAGSEPEAEDAWRLIITFIEEYLAGTSRNTSPEPTAISTPPAKPDLTVNGHTAA